MIKQYRINEVKKSQHLATTSRVYAAIVIVYSIEVLQPVVYQMLSNFAIISFRVLIVPSST